MIRIIRAPRRRRYSVISTEAIENRALSFKARGLLCYLLSKPDDWSIRTSELVNASDADGRDAVRAGLLELRAAGYLELIKERDKGGLIRSAYMLYEVPKKPRTEDGLTEDGLSGVGKAAALLNTDSPTNDNTSIIINNIDIVKILEANGGEAAPRLIELAAAARLSTWQRMFNRYDDPEFFTRTLAAMAAHYANAAPKLKRLKSITQTANNWLKKEYIDADLLEYRAAYLATVKAAAGVDYDFNNNPKGTDVIGLNSLIKQIGANVATLAPLLGLSTNAEKISVYKAFLKAAPDFWKGQRPAALARGFANIVNTIKQTKAPKAKPGGYASFNSDDISNIICD